MSKPDPEELGKELAGLLKSDEFNELLAAIYAEKGEALVEYPREVYATARWLPQVFPCGELQISTGDRQNPGDYVIDIVYQFNLFWHVQGSSEERLQYELGRLIRATEDFFQSRPHLNNAGVWTGNSDYSPLTRLSENGPLVKSGLIQILVRAQR